MAKTRKPTLADNIVLHLREHELRQLGTWELANALFNNCMQRALPGNGARVAALCRAANNDPRLYLTDNQIGLL